MNDPYSILGVSKDATDDEIKKAYRELARKYHPDNYVNNPLADLASEKMKEINEAYDAIVEDRKSGSKKKNTKDGYTPPNDFLDVREMITKGKLDQAQIVLDGVPVNKRNAEWYFLNGMVQFKRGYFDNAYSSFANAVRLDPSNPEYAQAYRNIQRRAGSNYGGVGGNPYRGPSNGGGMDACDCCQGLICADCCCECMGGDLISCC